MAKYMMVYKVDEKFDMSTMSKEEIAKEMEVWGEWLGSMGSAVVDEGDAFKEGKVLSGGDVSDADGLTTGYTIIEAKDFDEALSYAKTNPSLAQGGRVEVYEAFGL